MLSLLINYNIKNQAIICVHLSEIYLYKHIFKNTDDLLIKLIHTKKKGFNLI